MMTFAELRAREARRARLHAVARWCLLAALTVLVLAVFAATPSDVAIAGGGA